MEIALAEINESGAAGEGRILELTIEDTASDATQATTLFRGFADDPEVVAIIGPSYTPEALAVGPVAEQGKIVDLNPSANAEGIALQGPYVFQTAASVKKHVDATVPVLDELGIESMIVVFARDNQGQADQGNYAQETFSGAGVEVSQESVLLETSDYSSIVTKLVSDDVDSVFLAFGAEQGAAFAIAAREGGFDGQLIGSASFAASALIENGQDAVEGIVFASDYDSASDNELNQAFVATHEAANGGPPDNYAALGYTAMQLIGAAIGQIPAGEDVTRDAIRDALEGLDAVPTVLGTGEFSFNDDGGADYTPAVITVEGGEFLPWTP